MSQDNKQQPLSPSSYESQQLLQSQNFATLNSEPSENAIQTTKVIIGSNSLKNQSNPQIVIVNQASDGKSNNIRKSYFVKERFTMLEQPQTDEENLKLEQKKFQQSDQSLKIQNNRNKNTRQQTAMVSVQRIQPHEEGEMDDEQASEKGYGSQKNLSFFVNSNNNSVKKSNPQTSGGKDQSGSRFAKNSGSTNNRRKAGGKKKQNRQHDSQQQLRDSIDTRQNATLNQIELDQFGLDRADAAALQSSVLLAQGDDRQPKKQNNLDYIWKTIKKQQIVRNFITNLKDVSYYRDKKALTKMHYDLIADKCWEPEEISEYNTILRVRDQIAIIGKIFMSFARGIGVISPDQISVIVWKCILFLTCLLELFKIPLKAAFALDFQTGAQFYYFYLIPLIIFLMEIVLNFNLGYYFDGAIVHDRRRIFDHYLRHMFWIDVINSVTLLFTSYLDPILLYLSFFFRAVQLKSTISIMDEYFQFTQRYQTTFTLLSLTVQVLFVAHFVGCGFYSVANYEIQTLQQSDTWLDAHGITDESWQVKYVFSLYYSIITMCTVGYGDVTPTTNLERIYCIVIVIFSCGVFAYAINTIGQLFNDIVRQKAIIDKQKYQVSEYLSQRSIHRDLRTKVLKYLDYIHDKENDDPRSGRLILDTVSKNLREEIQRQYYGKILKKWIVIQQHFSEKCIEQLALNMEETTFGPGENIFQTGEADKRIFYIEKGEVELYMETKLIGSIKEGEFLGQSGFLSGLPRETTARSRNITLIVYMHQDSCVQILKQFPQDYEKYCELRDQIVIQQTKNSSKCFSCKKTGHTVLHCPMLHFTIQKSKFITHSYRLMWQSRQAGHKRNSYKFSTLGSVRVVRQQLRKYREITISECRNEDPPSDFENDIEDEDDHEFFMRCEKIDYENGQMKILDFDTEDEEGYDDSDYSYNNKRSASSSSSSSIDSNSSKRQNSSVRSKGSSHSSQEHKFKPHQRGRAQLQNSYADERMAAKTSTPIESFAEIKEDGQEEDDCSSPSVGKQNKIKLQIKTQNKNNFLTLHQESPAAVIEIAPVQTKHDSANKASTSYSLQSQGGQNTEENIEGHSRSNSNNTHHQRRSIHSVKEESNDAEVSQSSRHAAQKSNNQQRNSISSSSCELTPHAENRDADGLVREVRVLPYNEAVHTENNNEIVFVDQDENEQIKTVADKFPSEAPPQQQQQSLRVLMDNNNQMEQISEEEEFDAENISYRTPKQYSQPRTISDDIREQLPNKASLGTQIQIRAEDSQQKHFSIELSESQEIPFARRDNLVQKINQQTALFGGENTKDQQLFKEHQAEPYLDLQQQIDSLSASKANKFEKQSQDSQSDTDMFWRMQIVESITPPQTTLHGEVGALDQSFQEDFVANKVKTYTNPPSTKREDIEEPSQLQQSLLNKKRLYRVSRSISKRSSDSVDNDKSISESNLSKDPHKEKKIPTIIINAATSELNSLSGGGIQRSIDKQRKSVILTSMIRMDRNGPRKQTVNQLPQQMMPSPQSDSHESSAPPASSSKITFQLPSPVPVAVPQQTGQQQRKSFVRRGSTRPNDSISTFQAMRALSAQATQQGLAANKIRDTQATRRLSTSLSKMSLKPFTQGGFLPGFPSQGGGLLQRREKEQKILKLASTPNKDKTGATTPQAAKEKKAAPGPKSLTEELILNSALGQLQSLQGIQTLTQQLSALFPQLQERQGTIIGGGQKKHGVDKELLQKQILVNNVPTRELFLYDMDQVKEFTNYLTNSNCSKVVKNLRKLQKQNLEKLASKQKTQETDPNSKKKSRASSTDQVKTSMMRLSGFNGMQNNTLHSVSNNQSLSQNNNNNLSNLQNDQFAEADTQKNALL